MGQQRTGGEPEKKGKREKPCSSFSELQHLKGTQGALLGEFWAKKLVLEPCALLKCVPLLSAPQIPPVPPSQDAAPLLSQPEILFFPFDFQELPLGPHGKQNIRRAGLAVQEGNQLMWG